MLSRKQGLLLGSGLLVLGIVWFIISIFSIKHDPAWISVTIVSTLSASAGVHFVDESINP